MGRGENEGGKDRDRRKKREKVKRMLGDRICEVPPKARFEEPKSPESLGSHRSQRQKGELLQNLLPPRPQLDLKIKYHCEYSFGLFVLDPQVLTV